MNEYEKKLENLMNDMERLMWEVIDEIGDLNVKHDLHELLEIYTDMFERYERDIDMGGF